MSPALVFVSVDFLRAQPLFIGQTGRREQELSTAASFQDPGGVALQSETVALSRDLEMGNEGRSTRQTIRPKQKWVTMKTKVPCPVQEARYLQVA